MTAKRLLVPILILWIPAAAALPEVANKDKPRHGEWDFRLEKVWEVGRAGDEVLGRPDGLAASSDGMLYLSDDGNRTDYVFGPGGTLVRPFAKRGEGPGEVQRHGRFFLAGGKVVIPDMGRLHYFSREGEYLKTVRKDCEPHAFVDEDRLIDAPLSAVFLPEGKGRISLCDLRSGRDTVLSEFSVFEGGVAYDEGRAMVDVVVPLLSPLMTIGYADGRLYWGMSDRYRISVTDLEGKALASFSVDRKKAGISKKEKRDYFRTGSMPADLLEQIVNSLPDEIACFHGIEVHGGLVFVFVPELDAGNGALRIRQIDIFSPEGAYLYRARLDFGGGRTHLTSPLKNLAIAGDALYAVLRDDEDNVLVAKYRIALPAL